MRVYSSRAVAPVVAVVCFSQRRVYRWKLSTRRRKRENKNRRSFGGLYTHTHTPRWNETECVYEGAITFLRDCSIYVAKKLLLLFSTWEKKNKRIFFYIFIPPPPSVPYFFFSFYILLLLPFVYLYIYRIHEPSGSGLSIFLLPSFALSLFLYIYDSLLVISHLSERSKNGILDLSVGTIVYSAPLGYWRAAGANLSERIQEVKTKKKRKKSSNKMVDPLLSRNVRDLCESTTAREIEK